MPISAGTRLGPYEVVSPLGAGGMGEVYRARDTRLGRDVALKVISGSFTYDPERVARFEREAQLLAALNHPHIATVHGLEEANGAQFLVMELVEGETLAARLSGGALPVAGALTIARQIADALQAAHDKGIIHRDLKPANIALTPDGQVKVLDFGLAKALDAAPAADVSMSPTLSLAATQAGVILGTAAYMAPEQARGKPADKRADVWAFGCVLYEMLCGRRPFEGEDASETMAFVMAREPDWSVLNDDVPQAVVTLLRGCLEKDRHQRTGDIAAALFVLKQPGLLQGVGSRANTVPERRWRRIASAAALAGGVAAVTSALWWVRAPDAALPRVSRTAIAAVEASPFVIEGNDRDVVITPDGAYVVYVGLAEGTTRGLYARRIDQLAAQPIVRGPVRGAFVSPDSQWAGFVENGVLKRVPISGGPAIPLLQLDGASRGAAWGPDESVYFATANSATGLQRVPVAGGAAEILTKPNPEAGESDHVWPELLPDGRILFTIASLTGGAESAQIAVLDPKSGQHSVVLRGGSHGRYVSTGHLVYVAAGTMRAVLVDLDTLETRGAPVPVVPRLWTNSIGLGDFAVARDGTLVYADSVGGTGVAGRTFVWVDRNGREEPISAPARPYLQPRLSADGTRMAVYVTDQQQDIWIWDFRRSSFTRLTTEPGADQAPLWSIDDKRILFSSSSSGATAIFTKDVDGTAPPARLTEPSGINHFSSSFTPDGKRLVFVEQKTTSRDLMVLNLEGDSRVQPLIETRFEDRNGVVSPDGRWLAYESDSSGEFEVYIRPFPNVDEMQRKVSVDGGTRPLWARNGRELFYVHPQGALMSVPVESGPVWNAGLPVRVLDAHYFHGGNNPARSYDVSPDGRRFLMLKETATDDAGRPPVIVIVQNWFEELKRLVPVN